MREDEQQRFKCPLCACTVYERISRGQRPVYACCGCTAVFLDARKFTEQDPRLGMQYSPGEKSPTR